jgi:hypothetical protein
MEARVTGVTLARHGLQRESRKSHMTHNSAEYDFT